MQGIIVSKPQDLTRSTSDSGAEAEHPRVVVAEDEALIRLDLVELLEEHGYEIVGQASDGEEAVRLANELEPDLIVMDVKMPKMDASLRPTRLPKTVFVLSSC
ncbi:response regulator [Cutibacterium acnes JCM 18909]|nr:response regulator [Cutibacterium acnes JCM 18909]